MKTKTIPCHDSQGSVLIESSIVLPFILLILFGIIQYGLIIAGQIVLQNASAVAVRHVTIDGFSNPNDVALAAKIVIEPFLDKDNLTSVQVDDTQLINGKQATTVTLEYGMPLLIPYVYPGSSGGIATLRASATMR